MGTAHSAKVYRRAHWYVLAIAIPTLAGFVPTYVALFGRMQPAHHLHFWTAFLWLALLFSQSLLITRGKLSLHRTMGILGVGLFTAFYISSMYVSWYSAGDAAARGVPRQQLLWVDSLAVNLALVAVVLAIIWRKSVNLHQRLMLATLFAVIVPGIGRSVSVFIVAPAGLPGVANPLIDFGGMLLGALIWAGADRFRNPVTLGVLASIVVLIVSTFTLGASEWWRDALAAYGNSQELYTPFR